MIYATCLNEQNEVINEDFEFSLLVENMSLQFQIIQEANFSDKIKRIKEVLHNILKWIRKKISELKTKLFNKKKQTQTKTYSDNYKYEIYELSSKYNEISYLLSTDKIETALDNEYFNADDFLKETLDYICEKNTDGDINNINTEDIVLQMSSVHSEVATKRIKDIEEWHKKLMSIVDKDFITFESKMNSFIDSMKDLDDKHMNILIQASNIYSTIALKMKHVVLDGIKIVTVHNNKVYQYCSEGKPIPEQKEEE